MFYKNILSSALILLVIFSSPGSLLAEWSDFYHEYTKAMGGSGTVTVMNSVVDLSDNVYLTGHYSGTVDFNPSEVEEEHTSNGGNDIFLTKINADGTYGYTKTIGGNGAEDDETEGGRDIAIDSLNNVYMVGNLVSLGVDFNTSDEDTDLHSRNEGQVFITKINADGSYGYTYTFNNDTSSYTSIAIDSDDNIYVSGDFRGEAGEFDPTPEGFDMLVNISNSSVFLTKLNADESYGGTTLRGAGSGTVFGRSVDIDSSDNVYLTGHYSDTVDFDPDGDGDEHTSVADTEDIFLTKINADGSYGYTKTMGGVEYGDSGVLVVFDSSDNVYLTGHYSDTVDFDPTGVGDEHTSNGGTDIFLTKINTDGSYGYTKTMGGVGEDRGNSVTVDSLNNVYISGYFASLVDFDPLGDGDEHSSNTDSNDIFITKINADASYGGTKIIGGDGADTGVSVTLDSIDNVYLSGSFSGTVDFDPSEVVEEYASIGATDIFLAKFSQSVPVTTYSLDYTAGANGTLTGTTSQTINEGEDATAVTAVPNAGYRFLDWSDASTTNPRTDTNITADLSVTANFESIPASNSSGSRSKKTTDPVTTQNPVESNSKPKFVYNLKIDTNSSNLKDLQKYLEDNGFSVDTTTSESGEVTTPPPSKFKFLVDFKLEANIPDVKELQKYLNANGFPVALSGNGSLGNESTYFGLKTKSALMLFQKSKGLVPDGVMGPITRSVINAN